MGFLNYLFDYIMPSQSEISTLSLPRNASLDEAQIRIKISRRNINDLKYADDNTLKAESEEELKSQEVKKLA